MNDMLSPQFHRLIKGLRGEVFRHSEDIISRNKGPFFHPSNLIDKLAVDANVAQLKVLYVLNHARLGDALEIAINQANVLDWSVFESAQVKSILRSLHRKIPKLDVADHGDKLARLSF